MGRKRKYQGIILPEVMDAYLSVKSGLSSKTLERYYYNLVTLSRHLSEVGVDIMDISEEDIEEIKSAMLEEGKKPDTVGRYLKDLMPFFKWLKTRRDVDDKEIARIVEYCKNTYKPTKGEQPNPALTISQQEELFQKLENPYLRFIVWGGISYGFRAQELCKLKIEDVNINASGVNDRAEPDWGHLTIHLSKGNKTRNVFILREHLPVWNMMFKVREVDEIDFPQVFYWNMKPIISHNIPSLFKSHIASQVEFKVTSHCLRRTFATNLYRRGVGIVVIQNLLGHETIDVTRRYLNIMETETRVNYLETIQNKERKYGEIRKIGD